MGGQYRVLVHSSNYDRHSLSISDKQSSVSMGNLRLRSWFNVYEPEREDHGVHVQLEIGGISFGEEREFPKTSTTDGKEVGLELRRGYLWYKPSADSLLRLGFLDWHDRFGQRPGFQDPLWSVDVYDSTRAVLANSVWDFNVGGASFEGSLSETGSQSCHYRLSLFALEKGDRSFTGEGGATLLAGDVDYGSDDALLGASIYYLRDNAQYSYGNFGGPLADYDSSQDLWAGLRGHLQLGRLLTSGFFIYNRGETESPNWKHEGHAAKLAADLALESTTLSFQCLFSSSNNTSSQTRSGEFRTIAQSERDNFGAQGYWSRLGLTSPRGPNDLNDLGVGLQNRGLGLLTLQTELQARLSDTVSFSAAVGWLRSARDNPSSGSSNMGVELLGELNWTIAGSLALDTGVAYLWTGDFYKSGPAGVRPEDLFTLYLRLQLEF